MTPLELPPLPAAVAALVRRLPQWPPSAALATALNLTLDRVLPRAALEPLSGRRVRLRVLDAGLTLSLHYRSGRFSPCSAQCPVDVEVSADAGVFLALALRQEDPDTLFFERRMAVTGDTELGLVVKNALDAVDWRLPGLAEGRLPGRGEVPLGGGRPRG
jgi:predicted lipid carrier protein YhbT